MRQWELLPALRGLSLYSHLQGKKLDATWWTVRAMSFAWVRSADVQ